MGFLPAFLDHTLGLVVSVAVHFFHHVHYSVSLSVFRGWLLIVFLVHQSSFWLQVSPELVRSLFESD